MLAQGVRQNDPIAEEGQRMAAMALFSAEMLSASFSLISSPRYWLTSGRQTTRKSWYSVKHNAQRRLEGLSFWSKIRE
jgi:hypothetical protein